MLSISSIFSAISGNFGASNKPRALDLPSRSIAGQADTVDDVVSLSSQAIQSARQSQSDSFKPPRSAVPTDSTAARIVDAPKTTPAESHRPISTPQPIERTVRAVEEPITMARNILAAAAVRMERIASQQSISRQAEDYPKTAPQSLASINPASFASPETRRSVAAYQENRDILNPVAPSSTFRISA